MRDLPPPARAALEALVDMLASERDAPSAVREPQEAWLVHVADSLVGVELGELVTAEAIADVGSGAGLPGLVLAAALPGARVDLIESVGRKCDFMRRAVDRMGIDNARVVCERSENWSAGDGREAYDAVTVRAVGRLATIAELASPLLREGGAVVAWKGRRDADEEAELERAAPRLAIEPVEVRWVGPYAGSRHRHLHLMRKAGPTPSELPRRPGLAKKRPLGG
ncbi:MAG TPA: 16S rRNA (guanine(527)-N(7))-methyltransferase RsmG [Solirubrobacterales bacterium]|nr:16S rRNA (guanine(527)-N(7))-methyltransferase RsmG [Solirubrobacterales bacterium]